MRWLDRAQAAIIKLLRYQVVVDHVERIDHRHGRRRTRSISKIIGGIGGSHTGSLPGSVRKLLLQRNRPTEIKNPDDEEHQQGQRESEFHNLGGALVSP